MQNVEWEDLESLYRIAFDIKGVNSPVFGSKLCHFLLPDAFPVYDRDVIRFAARDYEDYWRFCKTQWMSCETKKELKDLLSREIGLDVAPRYPFTTKVTELCIIGSRVTGQDTSGNLSKGTKPNGGKKMPQQTIQLLDLLSSYGFADEDLRIVHHMDGFTIQRMRDYCERTQSFRDDSTNEKVRDRLQMILAMFLAGNFTRPAQQGVFNDLARAAVREIPK
jgi:hypothetical protein